MFFTKGIIVGFSASVPLGPIGVLCIQKTVNKGRISGFVSGLGAATADTFFAVIAGFGLTFISNFLIRQQLPLRILGSLILFYLGYKIFTTNPGTQLRKQLRKKRKGLLEDYLSIFFLTVSNPLTIFLFGGVFAGFGIIVEGTDFYALLLLVAGVFVGAALWWTTLTSIVNIFRSKFRLRRLLWINKITGIAIIAFAIFAALSIFFLDAKDF